MNASTMTRRLRVASDRGVTAAPEHAAQALDGVLEELELRPLPATELRILLAVRAGDTSVPELADTLDRAPVEIRQGAAYLFARGLLHWRHDALTREPLFRPTPAGHDTLQRLLDAAVPSPRAAARPSKAA
jgi:hypothetical protein